MFWACRCALVHFVLRLKFFTLLRCMRIKKYALSAFDRSFSFARNIVLNSLHLSLSNTADSDMEHNVLLHFLHSSYSRALYLHKFLLNCLWLLLAALLCFCHFYSFSFCPKFIMQPVFNSLFFSLHRFKCSFMKSFEYNGCVCVCMYCVLKILLLMFEPHFERICERKGEKYQERMEFERSRLWGKSRWKFLILI